MVETVVASILSFVGVILALAKNQKVKQALALAFRLTQSTDAMKAAQDTIAIQKEQLALQAEKIASLQSEVTELRAIVEVLRNEVSGSARIIELSKRVDADHDAIITALDRLVTKYA